jgi:hypothetical protein
MLRRFWTQVFGEPFCDSITVTDVRDIISDYLNSRPFSFVPFVWDVQPTLQYALAISRESIGYFDQSISLRVTCGENDTMEVSLQERMTKQNNNDGWPYKLILAAKSREKGTIGDDDNPHKFYSLKPIPYFVNWKSGDILTIWCDHGTPKSLNDSNDWWYSFGRIPDPFIDPLSISSPPPLPPTPQPHLRSMLEQFLAPSISMAINDGPLVKIYRNLGDLGKLRVVVECWTQEDPACCSAEFVDTPNLPIQHPRA